MNLEGEVPRYQLDAGLVGEVVDGVGGYLRYVGVMQRLLQEDMNLPGKVPQRTEKLRQVGWAL